MGGVRAVRYWRGVVDVVYVRGVGVLVYVNLSTRLVGCLEGDTRAGWEGGVEATSQKTPGRQRILADDSGD